MVAVWSLRTHHANHPHALLRRGLLHHVGGLLLRIDFAVVGHRRSVEEVDGIVRGVVQVIELLLFRAGGHDGA